MKKRATALLLILLMVVSLMPALGAGALAAGEETYKLATEMIAAGDKVIIANSNSGSIYIYSNGGDSNSKTVQVSGDSVTIDPTGVEFTVVAQDNNAIAFEQDGKYMCFRSGKLTMDSDPSYRPWKYDIDTHHLTCVVSNSTYYLRYSSSSSAFQGSTSTGNIYFFVKQNGSGSDDPIAVTGVSLDKTELKLEEGETATLKASVSPGNATYKAVSWSSDKTTVATVDDNGKVTAVAEGTATITVTTEDGNKTATCAVTVTKATEKPTYQLVDEPEDGGEYLIVSSNSAGSAYALKNPGGTSAGAAMDSTSVTIGADGIVKTADTDVIWTVTKNGAGFNLKNGTDTLEGKSGDVKIFNSVQYADRYWTYTENQLKHNGGNNTYIVYYDNGFKATYNSSTEKVYFYEKVSESTDPVAVTGVELDKGTMALTVGGTGTLTATVAPEDAANKNVTWSSSDTAVATVDNGIVTAVAAGTATITVTTEDGNKTATCDVTVTAPQEIESSVIELMKLKNNSSVWLIQVEAEAGKGFTYKGTAMVWSSRYEAYVIAVESATKPEPVAADFAAAGDAAAAVEYPAANDANGSKKVDMADVQYIYNLYSGKYETLEAAGDVTKVLGADINGDGVIDSKDATPILTALRGAQA